MKEPIKLRRKALKDGGFSLYLDYYHNGIREYRTLNLYLLPEVDKVSRDKNKRTLEAAQTIQARELVKLQEGAAGIRKPSNRGITLDAFLDKRAGEETKPTASATLKNKQRWFACFGKYQKVAAISPEMLTEFSRWLSAKYSANTAFYAYAMIVGHIHEAYRQGLIATDPSRMVAKADKPKRGKTEREFLTMEELRELIDAPCTHKEVKEAFLFSCFTGLRISDLLTLRWEDIQDGFVVKTMVKTKRVVRVPLSENAQRWMPERKGEFVFSLPPETTRYRALRSWAAEAGLKKRFGFHCARHTFATMLLTYGADLYTVSKLVGHTDIATTQIYAKIVDKKKEDAVNKLPKF